jgi:phage baseplate assembly protein W
MAITRAYQFQRNTFDINKNQTIGLAFPLINEGQFTRTNSFSDQIKANIINVLLTERGERPMQPDFGVGLKNLLFENIENADEIKPEIEAQLGLYVPDIQILDLNSEFLQDNHLLHITLAYQILNTAERDAVDINVRSQGGTPTIDISR